MQPDSSISQGQSAPMPAKKPGKFNFQIVLLIVFLLASAGLGYWAFQTSSALQAAQQSLDTLQGKYDALTAEKNSLSGELDQTKTELASVNSEIEATRASVDTTKSDVSKANADISALKKKMEKSRIYIVIMQSVFEEDDFIITALLVALADDDKLQDLFDAYIDTNTSVDFITWVGYVLTTAQNILTE